MTHVMTELVSIEVEQIAKCKRGTLGIIKRGPDKNGVYHGVKLNDQTKRWQSKCPEMVVTIITPKK